MGVTAFQRTGLYSKTTETAYVKIKGGGPNKTPEGSGVK